MLAPRKSKLWGVHSIESKSDGVFEIGADLPLQRQRRGLRAGGGRATAQSEGVARHRALGVR
jgi:hypothetical protein